MRSDNWNNPNVQQEIPARVIAQFLFPFSTDSQDTGKGPSIPLMGIFYTYKQQNGFIKFQESNNYRWYIFYEVYISHLISWKENVYCSREEVSGGKCLHENVELRKRWFSKEGRGKYIVN